MANAASVYAENKILDHSLGTAAWTSPDVYLGFTTPTGQTVTFTNATNIINLSTHGKSAGDVVLFNNSGGALPAEISAQVRYYVINPNANDFQISATLGGAALTFSDDGTGTSKVYEGLKEDGSNRASLECSTGGFARQDATFGVASGGSASNSSSHTFTASAADYGDVVEWLIMDASTAGNIVYHFPLTTMRNILDGESLTVAAAALVITAD